MKKILIIGISGLLGSRLLEIGRDKYEIYGTYNTHQVKGNKFFKLDATDKQEVFNLMDKIKPDLVVDTHSVTNVDFCETHKDEAWNVNVNGLRNIAEACKTFGSKLVFLSTDYVFDGKKVDYGEKDKPAPLNYYGKTKVICEKVIEFLGVNHIILRTTVIYGYGGQNKKSFVTWVIENLKQGKELRVVIDQFSQPTLADDLAKVILDLFEKDANGLFHAVGKDCINRYEFALKVAEHFKLNKKLIKPITTPELNQVAPRALKLSVSTNKLERVLGRGLVGIDDGLRVVKGQMAE